MKLEGSLDTFSLPDIFQLLSFTKKTGGLHLECGGNDGVVFFGTGLITGASADSSRQPLARRLIGAGVVDDEALAAAVQIATQGHGVGVAKALLDNGAIEAGMVRQAVADQTVDAVFDLLRWNDGSFAFVLDEGNPDDVGVTLGIDTVVSDADARKSSWEAVSALVPSSHAILAMPIVLPGDPQISREEWSLLAFVDGRRTVGELVDLTGSGQYAVVSLLAGLVGRGLLEVRDDDTPDHVGVVVRRQGLLAPLEGVPFTPTLEPVPEPPPVEEPPVAEAPVEDAPAEEAPYAGELVGAGAPDPSEPGIGGITDHVITDGEPWSGSDASTDQPDTFDQPVSDEPALVTAYAGDGPDMLGGAHVPGDVVPPRPEPFLPRRQADFDDGSHAAASPLAGRPMPMHAGGVSGDVIGSTAVALDPEAASVIERDPNVNRSLMLRLIAGVRGL